ncbi:MAG: hypothetical protein EHM64_11365 [Ignavibacteriae bacterium]|nr:MAG: hypothetical protein EHM64_11365 [Ignavibacteriota bacterium]
MRQRSFRGFFSEGINHFIFTANNICGHQSLPLGIALVLLNIAATGEPFIRVPVLMLNGYSYKT